MTTHDSARRPEPSPLEQDATAPGGLARLLTIVRRRWYLVLLPMVIGAAAGYYFASSEPPEYKSSASLLFRTRDLSQTAAETASIDTTRQAATNVDLVSSDEVAQRVATSLGGGATLDGVRDQVGISSRGDSDLVSISARDRDPERAGLIANTWANEYIAFRQEADRSQIARTIRLIDERLAGLSSAEAEGSEGGVLRARRNELEITASLQTGNAEVVETARPSTTPVSPRPRRSAAIAGFVGLLLGLVAALIADRLDRRIEDAGQLEKLMGVPILGRIPNAKALGAGGQVGTGRAALTGDTSQAILEAFRVLRTNITFFNVNRKVEALLVTSALPGEGKTTVAVRLAAAFADAGADTLLVEGDLRRPVLADRLGLPPSPGLTNLLVATRDATPVVHVLSLGSGESAGPRAQLDVLVAGPVPPNPQELLESERMTAVMQQFREHYDVVILDSSPMLLVADTSSLMRHASGVVVVSRIEETSIDAVTKLRAQFNLLNVKPLGIVVNAADKESAFTYYGGIPVPSTSADARDSRSLR